MSYSDLIGVEVNLDFSTLENRLDDLDRKVEGIEALDEDGVQALIDNAIESIDGFVSTDDFDADDSESRLREVEGNVGDHEDRLAALENASPSGQDDQARAIEQLRERVAELAEQVASYREEARKTITFFDLLRQAAHILIERAR